jgi:hypothetical protein
MPNLASSAVSESSRFTVKRFRSTPFVTVTAFTPKSRCIRHVHASLTQ